MTTPIPTAEELSQLQAKAEATAAVAAEAQANAQNVAKKGGFQESMAAFEDAKRATTEANKAAAALKDAQNLYDNSSKLQAIADATSVVQQFTSNPAVSAVFDNGATGISIGRAEDGTYTVTVAHPFTRKAQKSSGLSRTVNRGKWQYNGGEYTSRELFQFGNEEDLAALAKADSWKERGLKIAPGFQVQLTKLANRLGATR